MRSVLLEYLTDEALDFKAHFRITRTTFRRLMEVLWQGAPDTTHGWGRELELLTFLLWLGCGAAFRVVAACVSMPRASAFNAVNNVLERITANLHRMIYLPRETDLDAIQHGFASKAGSEHMTGFVGAIDGTHIRVLVPQALHDDYINRKWFYSVQLQAVCDNEGVFLDIFSGYPGSVHDSRVLKNSPLYRRALYPPPGYALLGDSGYPCISTLVTIVTLYKMPSNPVETRFNKAHSKARSILERSPLA